MYRTQSLWMTMILVCCSILTVSAQELPSGWKQFSQCPVKADRTIEVDSDESGHLQSMNVKRNDWILQGAVIAELDSEGIENELQIASLQHENAKSLASDMTDIQFREYALQEAQADLENHRSIQGRVSGWEITQRELAVASARVNLNRAKNELKRRQLESELQAARVKALQIRLSRHTIRAPIQGAVLEVVKQPGQWVETGETLVRIADLESLVIDQTLPSDVDRSRLKGAEAFVVFDSNGKSFRLRGEVESYDPQENAQGEIWFHVRVRNQRQDGEWLLLPGKPVTIYVNLSDQATRSAQAVP